MCGICELARSPNSLLSSEQASSAMDGLFSSIQANTIGSLSSQVPTLLDGISFTGTNGVSATVTYSFSTPADLPGGVGAPAAFNGTQQAHAEQALANIAAVANVNFVRTTGSSADITFGIADLDGYNGAAGTTFILFDSNDVIQTAGVVLDNDYANTAPVSGSYDVLIHEIGHALGLKHPGNYSFGGFVEKGPFLPENLDSELATVMSYTPNALGRTTSLGILDILALQFIYGANQTSSSGNDTYSFDGAGNTPFYTTIYDTGGVDTVNLQAVTAGGVSQQGGATIVSGVTINLNPGIDFISGGGAQSFVIAENVTLENAVGSFSSPNFITGNSVGNDIKGGHASGGDILRGGSGNDTVYGGIAVADPEDTQDEIYGDGGSDLIYGNAGNDTLFGGVAIADANDGNDTIYGGYGNDSLYGNSGDDSLYGGGGNADPGDLGDFIYGGRGSDALFGNGGNDTLYGGGNRADPGDQNDIIYGGVGDDEWRAGRRYLRLHP